MNRITKIFLSIIFLIYSISAFSLTRVSHQKKSSGERTLKVKQGYYFHVSVHDNGSNGFVYGGYPQHNYNVYVYITPTSAANLTTCLPVTEDINCNSSFLVTSDSHLSPISIEKQYVINRGAGYYEDVVPAGANLKITINSISLSTYLYKGNTIHIDYKVHYF